MPHARIDMHETLRPKMAEMSAAILKGMVDGLDMPADDLFQIFRLHAPGELVFSPTHPNADRTDIIFIEILSSPNYSAEQMRLGKTVGDDFREGKVTLPVILAIHRGSEAERAFWHRTLDEAASRDGDLEHAQDLLRRHHALRDAIDRARHYGAIARDALGLFPDSPVRQALLDIIDFTVEREF